MLKTIRINAVVAGLATDIAGPIAVGWVLAILIGVIAGMSGDVTPQHMAALKANIFLKVVGLCGTTLSTMLGGYVAAGRAEPYGLRNFLAVGILSLALGLLLGAAAPGVTPGWKLLLGLLLTVPAALVGGRLAKQPRM